MVLGTKSSPAPQFRCINFFTLSILYGPSLTSVRDYWKNHSFDYMAFDRQMMFLLFNTVSRLNTRKKFFFFLPYGFNQDLDLRPILFLHMWKNYLRKKPIHIKAKWTYAKRMKEEKQECIEGVMKPIP